MLLKFDANQDYQLQAIEAVVGPFDGQPHNEAMHRWNKNGGFSAIANSLDLDDNLPYRYYAYKSEIFHRDCVLHRAPGPASQPRHSDDRPAATYHAAGSTIA